MNTPLLHDVVIILCLSIIVLFSCNKLKIHPVLGFLITGIVCGPYGLRLVHVVEQVEMVSEIGVIMLMFSIGMEMSIPELIRLKKPVLIGGSAQVFLTIFLFMLFEEILGMGWNSAIAAGSVIALSSTAIIMSLMQQRAEVNSPQGRVILAVLLYQDIIVVPMMLAIPMLAGSSTPLGVKALQTAGSTILILGMVFLLARKGVPLILRYVARTRIRELFLMCILGICLAIAYITSMLGLSLALGAFIAGIVMSESEYSHSALEGIMPFKDVFTSLFFISVGMLLDTAYFIDNLIPVLLLAVAVIFIKSFCGAATGKILGYPLRTSILIGIGLSQVGEFSFVLIKAGLDVNLFDYDTYQTFLATIIVTMASTPLLFNAAPRIAAVVSGLFCKSGPIEEVENNMPGKLSGHLIILGFGVAGQHLAHAAKYASIPYVILEMNPDTVVKYKGTEPIRYGDATQRGVLEELRLSRAKLLAVVISDGKAAASITEIARHMNPGLHILTRTAFWGQVDKVKRLGASEVVSAEFETSIAIFTRVLKYFSIPDDSVAEITRQIRVDAHPELTEATETDLPPGTAPQ